MLYISFAHSLQDLFKLGVRFAVTIKQTGMLSALLSRNENGRINQAAIVPTHEVRSLKRPQEKLGGPFSSLFEIVGDGAVRTRHDVGRHGECRIAIDEWLVGQLRPTIQSGLAGLRNEHTFDKKPDPYTGW